jgi:Arc/MetJ family transcription regulator
MRVGSGGGFHRTTIEIEEAYERARKALGTRGYKDTVNEALRAVDRAARLQRGADLIRAGDLNLTTPDELEELRKPRH